MIIPKTCGFGMEKPAKKLAENSHFRSRLQRGFRYGRHWCRFGQMAAKTRRKPRNRKLMAVARLAVGFGSQLSGRSVRQQTKRPAATIPNDGFSLKRSFVTGQPNVCFAPEADIQVVLPRPSLGKAVCCKREYQISRSRA
jgi:hypothetical protein